MHQPLQQFSKVANGSPAIAEATLLTLHARPLWTSSDLPPSTWWALAIFLGGYKGSPTADQHDPCGHLSPPPCISVDLPPPKCPWTEPIQSGTNSPIRDQDHCRVTLTGEGKIMRETSPTKAPQWAGAKYQVWLQALTTNKSSGATQKKALQFRATEVLENNWSDSTQAQGGSRLAH